jgi:hypothetical protein
MSGQNVSTAVMARRKEPHDSLDYFPTPAWGTRALCEWLHDHGDVFLNTRIAWEPACGDGYMSRPLAEFFADVISSDVHPYGYGLVEDFLWPSEHTADWIITNPPFRLAEQFAETAIVRAKLGVAILVRTAFLESIGRFEGLFTRNPPSDILQFVERLPMVKGKVDADASSATAYCWLVWRKHATPGTQFHWIPPCRKRLERASDYEAAE